METTYHKKDLWAVENRKYTEPHLRLLKVARVVNDLAGQSPTELLDVGCGPGTLQKFLRPNIVYHGVDISIPNPGPRMAERDILAGPIAFEAKRFGLVVAQGLFEYLGDHQSEKLAEISRLLAPGGTLLASYVNFDHRRPTVYELYNNVRAPGAFEADLERYFTVRRRIPTSHNWQHQEPAKWPAKPLNLRLDASVPWLTRKLAVQYLFLCSPLDNLSSRPGGGAPEPQRTSRSRA